MRNLKLLLATTVFVAAAVVTSAVNAGNGVWTSVYSDKTNNIFVSELRTSVSLSTPPLPLNFPGSRVVGSVSTISGTNDQFGIWGTLSGPIGTTPTTIAGVAGVSASIIPSSTLSFTGGGSLTTITTNNSLHDVGYTISASVAGVTVRVIEIKQ